MVPRLQYELRVLRQHPAGPAAARGRALRAARGGVVLFLGDDTWPAGDLLARHADFHRRRPARSAALLGRIVPAPELGSTPFMDWLEASGLRFAYHTIRENEGLPGAFFYTSNTSAKAALVVEAGGFEGPYPYAAHEDTDLGVRMERVGMQLAYDPAALP